MKTLKTLAMVAVLSLTMSCQKEEISEVTPQLIDSENARFYNLFRVYVMDPRFSRATCATGPGVCFKDGVGHIWDYNFYDNSIGNNDVGPIGISLTEKGLHLGFFRSLEEKELIIAEDAVLDQGVTNALGKKRIIIKAGRYSVAFNRLRHGESKVDAIMD